MNAALASRLRFIDFVLAHFGSFNRVHLEDYFGISTPQASNDIALYTKNNPTNLWYDKSQKCYRVSDKFERAYP